MPYVKPNWREHFDKTIMLLSEDLHEFGLYAERPGAVNYVISRLVSNAMRPTEGWSYSDLSRALAVFQDAEAEMRRRLLDPYENKAIERNGDIPEYENS